MKVVIDRFENGFAIVELPDMTTEHIPLKLLPYAKEGDVVSIEIDKIETAFRESKIKEKMNRLWKD